MGASSTSWQPPPGLIFDIAEAAGIEIKVRRAKTPIRCPFHEDRTESAFLSESNVFFCSCCTPARGWSAKQFAEALDIDWLTVRPTEFRSVQPRPSQPASATSFGPTEAAEVWAKAYERMRDDNAVEEDRPSWNYLSRRKLSAAYEYASLGVLAVGMSLPTAVSYWPARGYRIIAPLFDASGSIANVQARTITEAKPKTLFPEGSRASGTLFACARGLELLRGLASAGGRVLFAEGLTDHLALTVASPVPVLSAPGTSMAVAGVGSWVRGRELFIALDWDAAGDGALQAVAESAYAHGASRVHRVDWPHGAKDACHVIELHGTDSLREFLSRVFGEVPR